MVGTARFELATPCTPSKCATRLRYVPMEYAAEIGSEGDLTSEFYTSRARTARAPVRMVVFQSEKHDSYQGIAFSDAVNGAKFIRLQPLRACPHNPQRLKPSYAGQIKRYA